MVRGLDALTALSLKHIRERWWNQAFAEFLEQAIRPKPGKRMLDVGCGAGTAVVSSLRLQISQLRLFGVDLNLDRLRQARDAVRGINGRADFASADAGRLPFVDGAFDSTYCVAVLQHVHDVPAALAEFARVTRPGGRVLAVEPDNAARYMYSSVPSGAEAFDLGRRFFAELAALRGEAPAAAIGPALPGLFTAAGIQPLSVDVFPVSAAYIGPPPRALWQTRNETIEKATALASDESLRRLGLDYRAAMDQYARDAAAAGAGFVEIQNTMLFASLGERQEAG